MKRITIIAIISILCLSFAACGPKDPQQESSLTTLISSKGDVTETSSAVIDESSNSITADETSTVEPVSSESPASDDESDPKERSESSSTLIYVPPVVSKDTSEVVSDPDESSEAPVVVTGSIKNALQSLGVVSKNNAILVCYSSAKDEDGGIPVYVIVNNGSGSATRTFYKYYEDVTAYEAAKAGAAEYNDATRLITFGTSADDAVGNYNEHILVFMMGYVPYAGE